MADSRRWPPGIDTAYRAPRASLAPPSAPPGRHWVYAGFLGAFTGTVGLQVVVGVLLLAFGDFKGLQDLALLIVAWLPVMLVASLVTLTYGALAYVSWLRRMPQTAWRFLVAGGLPGVLVLGLSLLDDSPSPSTYLYGAVMGVYGVVISRCALYFLRRQAQARLSDAGDSGMDAGSQ